MILLNTAQDLERLKEIQMKDKNIKNATMEAAAQEIGRMDNLYSKNIITNYKTAYSDVYEFTLQDLRKSSINDENIAYVLINEYIVIDKDGYYIYYPELHQNKRSGYYNKRLKNPTDNCKYVKPAGMSSKIYRPPFLDIKTLLDKNIPIIFTEGEKKAMKATQEGFYTCALPGVTSWLKSPIPKDLKEKSKEELLEYIKTHENIDEDETLDIIPDIVNADWKDKEIILCYDADLYYKEQVKIALYKFAAYMISEHKAKIKIALLPQTEAKGIDDYLIAYGKEAFQKVLDGAQELTLKDIQNVLSGNNERLLPFPTNIFPKDLEDMIRNLSEKMDAPVEYIASAVLVGASTLMDGRCEIDVLGNKSWIDYPILYNAIIGMASEMKSPCLKVAVDILNEFDERLYNGYKEDLSKYKEDKLDYEIKLRLYKREVQNNPQAEKPKAPIKPRNKMLTIQSTTVESLVSAVADNEGLGIGIIVDELASFLKSLGQYKGGRGNDEEYFLQAWKRNKYRYKRKSSNEDLLVYPSHNILGTIQPQVLIKELFDNKFETTNGMIERWLFTCTDYKQKGVTLICNEEYNPKPLKRIYETIYKIKPTETYKFSKEAQIAYIEYKDYISKIKNSDNMPELMKTYLQKQTDYTARFSLVLHCMENCNSSEIQTHTVRNAIKLSQYHISCFKRIASLVASTSSNSLAMSTLDFLRLKGIRDITPSRLYKGNTSKYKTPAMAKLVLGVLANSGYGRLVKTLNGGCKFHLYT